VGQKKKALGNRAEKAKNASRYLYAGTTHSHEILKARIPYFIGAHQKKDAVQGHSVLETKGSQEEKTGVQKIQGPGTGRASLVHGVYLGVEVPVRRRGGGRWTKAKGPGMSSCNSKLFSEPDEGGWKIVKIEENSDHHS